MRNAHLSSYPLLEKNEPCPSSGAAPSADGTGITTYYSGNAGEIRHSSFYSLSKDFKDKSCLSFKYVLKGQEQYAVDGKTYEVNEKQVLFFADNKAYEARIEHPRLTRGLCIDLNLEMKELACIDALNEKEQFFFSPEFKTQKINFLDNAMHKLLQQIEGSHVQDQSLRLEEIHKEVCHQVLQMEGEYVERMSAVPIKNRTYKRELFARLIAVKNYIQDHKTQKIKLSDIASENGLSAFYLHRLFKQVFGLTPAQYQENIRMQEAQQHLKRLSAKETSLALGFEDEAYFSRRFKRYFGTTPGQFARIHR